MNSNCIIVCPTSIECFFLSFFHVFSTIRMEKRTEEWIDRQIHFSVHCNLKLIDIRSGIRFRTRWLFPLRCDESFAQFFFFLSESSSSCYFQCDWNKHTYTRGTRVRGEKKIEKKERRTAADKSSCFW